MTKLEIENLLRETDWLYCDDVKDLVTNLDEFTEYRKEIRLFRIQIATGDDITDVYGFTPPTKPTIVWKEGITEE